MLCGNVSVSYDYKDNSNHNDDDDTGECGRNCENQFVAENLHRMSLARAQSLNLCLKSNSPTVRLLLQELTSSLHFVL